LNVSGLALTGWGWWLARASSWRALIAWLVASFVVVLGGALAGGFLLQVWERADGSTAVDGAIAERVVANRTSGLTSFAQALSRVGSTSVLFPLVVIVAGVLVWRRRWVFAAFAIVVWGGSVGLYNASKAVVERPRPPVGFRLASAAGSSFPSGHATQSLATWCVLAIVVAAVWRPARFVGWVAAGLVVLGVGWSRLYLGMHWATDVVAGWLIGAAWLVLASQFVQQAGHLVTEVKRREETPRERPNPGGRGGSAH
jgi:undecaprenyl-diphosphatase